MIFQAIIGLVMLVVAIALGVALISIFSGVFAATGSSLVVAGSKLRDAYSRRSQQPEAPVFSPAPTAFLEPEPVFSSGSEDRRLAA